MPSGEKLLVKFQAQYGLFEKQRQELANAEKLFDLPITKYDALIEVDMSLRNMTKVYDLYNAQKVHTPRRWRIGDRIAVYRCHVRTGPAHSGPT